MYQEKHYKRSRRRLGKSIALLVSLLLAVSVAVGGTIAFLMDSDGPLHNQFNPSQVTTKVEERLDGTTKSNVFIKNTGDTEAWIRAAVVVTWQNANGDVYGTAPVEGKDYSITYNLSGGWLSGADGFYYWSEPVKSVAEAPDDCSTGVLITSCSPVKTAPEGYYLTVEIIGSGIQSKPSSVFNTEWVSSGFTVNTDGTSIEKTNEGGASE